MSSTCTPSLVPDDDASITGLECETWMVFIDPEAGVRASRVLVLAYRQHLAISAKETCFGLMVEGERDVVRNLVDRLRDAFPSGLYFKRRPFSISDTKVCARTFNKLGLRRAAEQFRFHNNS